MKDRVVSHVVLKNLGFRGFGAGASRVDILWIKASVTPVRGLQTARDRNFEKILSHLPEPITRLENVREGRKSTHLPCDSSLSLRLAGPLWAGFFIW